MVENHKKSHWLQREKQGGGGDVTIVAQTKIQGRDGGSRERGEVDVPVDKHKHTPNLLQSSFPISPSLIHVIINPLGL